MKLLGRLGEVLWEPEDYRVLLKLKRRHSAAKLLQHLRTPDPASLRIAAGLPDVLLHPVILSRIPSADCAGELVEALEIIDRFDGQSAVAALARQMVQAKSSVSMMDRVGEVLVPHVFRPGVPVPNLPDTFVPIRDREQLKRVALAFKNCLRNYESDLACGQSAVFVFLSKPQVVFSIDRDARGWALEEAKLAGNKPVPKPLLRELSAHLDAVGVRVGTNLGELKRRLHQYACKECATPNYPPWPNWREQLATLDP